MEAGICPRTEFNRERTFALGASSSLPHRPAGPRAPQRARGPRRHMAAGLRHRVHRGRCRRLLVRVDHRPHASSAATCSATPRARSTSTSTAVVTTHPCSAVGAGVLVDFRPMLYRQHHVAAYHNRPHGSRGNGLSHQSSISGAAAAFIANAHRRGSEHGLVGAEHVLISPLTVPRVHFDFYRHSPPFATVLPRRPAHKDRAQERATLSGLWCKQKCPTSRFVLCAESHERFQRASASTCCECAVWRVEKACTGNARGGGVPRQPW